MNISNSVIKFAYGTFFGDGFVLERVATRGRGILALVGSEPGASKLAFLGRRMLAVHVKRLPLWFVPLTFTITKGWNYASCRNHPGRRCRDAHEV